MTIFYISNLWFLVGLIGIACKDERERRIPNQTVLALLLLWIFAFPVALAQTDVTGKMMVMILLSRLLPAGIVLFVTTLISFLRPQSLGMGDAKLMSLLLLYFDFSSALLALWLALLFTLLRGAVTHFRKGATALPFAPQVALGAGMVVALLWIRMA